MSTLLCCIAAIGLHVGSVHTDNSTGQSLNGFNPGIYLEHTSGITVGTYYNSLRRASYYVGYNYRMAPIYGVTPSVLVGGVTGYTTSPTWAIVPSLSYNMGDGVAVRLSYLPKVEATKVQTLHLSLEKRF
jgi:hypothetical protein